MWRPGSEKRGKKGEITSIVRSPFRGVPPPKKEPWRKKEEGKKGEERGGGGKGVRIPFLNFTIMTATAPHHKKKKREGKRGEGGGKGKRVRRRDARGTFGPLCMKPVCWPRRGAVRAIMGHPACGPNLPKKKKRGWRRIDRMLLGSYLPVFSSSRCVPCGKKKKERKGRKRGRGGSFS